MEFNENNLVLAQEIAGEMSEELKKKVLSLILQALRDEKADYEYHGKLLEMLDDEHEKEVIKAIQLDERKHYMLLSDIYYELAGSPPIVESTARKIGTCIVSELAKGILGKLERQEFYKKLLFAVSGMTRDIVFDIVSDKGRHATKFNYLFAKNRK